MPVTEVKGKEFKLMKKWASRPWATNLVHIPGLEALKSDLGVFAQKCLVMFCPEAISPPNMVAEYNSEGLMLIRDGSSWI